MEIESKYRSYPQTPEEIFTEAHELFEMHGEYCWAYVVHDKDAILFETLVSSPAEPLVMEGCQRPVDCQHQSPWMAVYTLWEVLLKMKEQGKTKIYWRMRPTLKRERHETHPYYAVMRVAFR